MGQLPLVEEVGMVDFGQVSHHQSCLCLLTLDKYYLTCKFLEASRIFSIFRKGCDDLIYKGQQRLIKLLRARFSLAKMS